MFAHNSSDIFLKFKIVLELDFYYQIFYFGERWHSIQNSLMLYSVTKS